MTVFLATRLVFRRSPPLLWRRSFSRAAVEAEKDTVAVPSLPLFDYSPPPYAGPTADEILAKRREYLSPSILHFYKNPVSPRTIRLFPHKYDKSLTFIHLISVSVTHKNLRVEALDNIDRTTV